VPGRRRPAADWAGVRGEGFEVLEAHAHSRKLPRGALAGNRFEIVLRDLAGDTGTLEAQVRDAAQRGVPNYFGPQRFGRDASNLARVRAWVDGGATGPGREQRAFVYSAARSLLFNAALAARVRGGTWDVLLPGELANLDGSRSWFRVEVVDEALVQRCVDGDVHPTGPLPGRGEDRPQGVAGTTEAAALQPHADVAAALAAAGLEGARRALRVRLRAPTMTCDDAGLTLEFGLPAGAYATAVVRELLAAGQDMEEGDDA
jgi:tRNA pseudouridine13 synthase